MSSNNGHSITKAQRRSEAIDKLLAGRSEAIRLNVVEYMLKHDVNPEHEFFVILVALGTLETLIESSPREWQEIFSLFQGELKEWADSNKETLTLLSQKADITERLASSSESLGKYLTKFLEICEGLISQLQKSNLSSINSQSQSQTLQTEFKNLREEHRKELSQLKTKLDKLNSLIENQEKSHPPDLRKIWTWKDSVLFSLITTVLLATVYLNVGQNRVVQHNNQIVQWLLYKANRQECLAGLKKPGSPECQGF